ncbi:MAG: carboxypeptidase regulatory-like domain-containing protein [Halochromatium sp.]|nr:carboxypeptidase regulatory-like domain-containing protein [Halochromatium sp.]
MSRFQRLVFDLASAAGITLVLSGSVGADNHTGGEVAFITGGVGASGRSEIEAVQDQYSLKLVFAYTNGDFLAEVKVVIRDAAGNTLVSTDADGPWLLVKLPAGSYQVAATVDGETKTEQVSVPASGLKTVNMLWKPPA